MDCLKTVDIMAHRYITPYLGREGLAAVEAVARVHERVPRLHVVQHLPTNVLIDFYLSLQKY